MLCVFFFFNVIAFLVNNIPVKGEDLMKRGMVVREKGKVRKKPPDTILEFLVLLS